MLITHRKLRATIGVGLSNRLLCLLGRSAVSSCLVKEVTNAPVKAYDLSEVRSFLLDRRTTKADDGRFDSAKNEELIEALLVVEAHISE